MAPKEAEFVDSIPPGYFGGNIDNWRIGKGAVMFYPVAVPGALFSVGDPHASQGDSELCGADGSPGAARERQIYYVLASDSPLEEDGFELSVPSDWKLEYVRTGQSRTVSLRSADPCYIQIQFLDGELPGTFLPARKPSIGVHQIGGGSVRGEAALL